VVEGSSVHPDGFNAAAAALTGTNSQSRSAAPERTLGLGMVLAVVLS